MDWGFCGLDVLTEIVKILYSSRGGSKNKGQGQQSNMDKC